MEHFVSNENKKRLVIGVVGFISSGKDTIADYLVNIHEFRRDSFAATLKDAVASVFGWDRELLDGRSRQSRAWREEVDQWWADRLNLPTLTPRWVLQNWGTEVCRQHFHDHIWIASIENKLRKTTDNIVITDCRFPNEITAIKNAGGRVIRVVRGPEPEWYEDAVAVNLGPTHISWALSKVNLQKYKIHISETAWVGSKFDAVLDNNNTLDHLYKQVNQLV